MNSSSAGLHELAPQPMTENEMNAELLRHYAGQAMQSIIIAIGIADATKKVPPEVQTYKYVAKWALGQAQAMIEAEAKLREGE